MRPVFFGIPPADPRTREYWLQNALAEIERASRDGDPGVIADAYTVENYTVTRTLDAATATATDVANVLCTLINDLKRRGTKRV